MSQPKFVIITGLSGAGKSTVVHVLEDLGFFCIDNLPPSLVPKLADLVDQSHSIGQVALVFDVRAGTFFDSTMTALDELHSRGYSYTILFLDASDEALIRRYKETRRRHPLAVDGGILDGIGRERSRMAEIKERADHVVDTSHVSPFALRHQIIDLISSGHAHRIQVNLISFGFKYGIPTDADMVLDVRFLPNPHYVPELASGTGNDPEVATFVLGH